MVRVQLEPLGIGTLTDEQGRFQFSKLQPGNYSLKIRSLAHQDIVRSVAIKDHEETFVESLLLPLTYSLPAVNLEAPVHPARPIQLINQLDLDLKPIISSQEVLRSIPGMTIGQHAGGGKAEQLFFRGFDLDHGTDFALSVDGMPVNMVSHAHGQGYADLHFLIPETIERIDVGKGPYDAAWGNFQTSGRANFQTINQLNHSTLKLEAGQFNTRRAVALLNLSGNNQNQQAFIAAEGLLSDGYFEASQNFHRWNFLGKYQARLGEKHQFKLSAGGFSSEWTASGQIPQRAVDAGLISRFGAIDSTEGGTTSRYHLNAQLESFLPGDFYLQQQIYAIRYDFDLYSNFTFFLENPEQGDQIRQTESRHIIGYRNSLKKESKLGRHNRKSSVGLDIRHDIIDDLALLQTFQRTTNLQSLANGAVRESQAGLYWDEVIELDNRWSVNGALRYDLFRFAHVNELENAQTSSRMEGIFSPKLNVSYQASPGIRFFLNLGQGFHSNDSRLLAADATQNALAKATGADLGLMWKASPRLLVQAGLWQLHLEDELVYVGDAGVVEASGETQRLGLEASVRYQPIDQLVLAADASLTHARSVEDPRGENFIPLAPWLSSSGSVQYVGTKNLSAGLQYRYLGLNIYGQAKEKEGVISFLIDGLHHYDVGIMVDRKGIAVRTGHHCTQPLMKRFGITGTIRASLAF
ncbi:MAG: TonB-dependent receptor, partial [Bacteroidota bacterium]